MTGAKLVPYTLTITKDGNPVDLTTLPAGGLTGIFEELFDELNEPTAAPADSRHFKPIRDMRELPEKTFTADAYRSKGGNAFEGVLQVGYAGIYADLLDTDSASRKKTRFEDDAEEYPFYMALLITKEKGKALLFLRKYRSRGIKQDLLDFVEEKISDFDTGVNVSGKPYTTERIINRIEQGKVRKIRVSRLKQDLSNLEKASDNGGPIEQVKSLGEITSDYDIGIDLRMVPSNDQKGLTEIAKEILTRAEGDEMEEDAQADIWCSTEHDGVNETFSLLQQEGQPTVSFDDAVKISGGHPRHDEMWDELSEYLREHSEYIDLVGDVPDLTTQEPNYSEFYSEASDG
jgi:hypothetical protein